MATRTFLCLLFILSTVFILSCPRKVLADDQGGDAPDDDSSSSSSGYKFMVAKQFERSVQNVAAGEPTSLWPPNPRRKKPLPTNKYWQNFVLNHGSAPEYIHPYTIQSTNSSSISIGFPTRQASQSSISQLHASDILVSATGLSSNLRPFVSRYDDLTVTLQLGDSLRVPLLRGSPYVTFLFSNSVPVVTSPHSIENVSVSSDSTKYSILLGNGQRWNLYSSAPIHLDGNLRTEEPFTGAIRLAMVPSSEGESLLDSHSRSFVTSARVTYASDSDSSPVTLSYIFRTEGMGDLLLLSLPLHRALLDYSDLRLSPEIHYQSIDGVLQGVIGSVWKLHSRSPTGSISWHSVAGIRSPRALATLGSALARDVSNLRPINISSTYFFGKSIARAARLALIAEEIGVSDLRSSLATYLDENLSPWLDATLSSNAIVYDSKWGGLISQQGAFDPGADFGLGLYNDHHYHWGYFVYAGAVLSKLDPDWGSRYRTTLYSLVGDYMSPGRMPRGGNGWGHFPRTRHFDPWVLHSWAGGLTEFGDGRNQESTSEAVNAYYSAALLGRAYGDEELVRMGSAMAGLEIWGAKSLWHVRKDSDLYEEEFVKRNRVSGVVWANKRDSNLWFSCGGSSERNEECRVGIQVIPVTPVTEALFEDVDYNRQVFEWVAGVMESDPWKGFAYAVQATYDPARARGNVELLERFDDGNSLTNMLWWVYSRPAAAGMDG